MSTVAHHDRTRHSRRDRIGKAVFIVSACLIFYGAGFMTALRNWPPTGTLAAAIGDTENLVENWRNDFGIEPTRLLVASNDQLRQRFAVLDRQAMAPGNRFISGLMPGHDSDIGIRLLDSHGAELHYWPVRYASLSQGERNPHAVFLHGTLPMPDGSVIVNFDNGNSIARIDPCGKLIWTTAGNFHHGISRSYDGTLWTWENVPATEDGAPDEEYIVQIDPETGHRVRRISLLDDVIAKHDLTGSFAIRSEEDADRIAWCCDPFHPNDVEVLTPADAPAFPMFRAGDLLISLRSLNMVAVVDADSTAVKWFHIGPWHRQHDPDFLPDGRISVLDNNMGGGASRIIAIDPASDAVEIVFDGAKDGEFYTWRRGRHQTLANGNVIIAETERGRAIEVDASRRVVWRYENVFDPERNGLVNDAQILPENFFEPGALGRCSGGRNAATGGL